jgi:hypothetical protein
MAGIKPIRVLVVYPALMRRTERRWRGSGSDFRDGIRAATTVMGPR